MQKNVRKMSLSRETLRVLDSTALQQAEGGAVTVQQNTTQRTALSLCFVCNEYPIAPAPGGAVNG
jgi:hypothetical protein